MYELFIFGICFAMSFLNYTLGYHTGHSDGFVEGSKSLVSASYKIRELEKDLRVCRIDKYNLYRKYYGLLRKIKAMEGMM